LGSCDEGFSKGDVMLQAELLPYFPVGKIEATMLQENETLKPGFSCDKPGTA